MFEDVVTSDAPIFKLLSMGETPDEFILRRLNGGWRNETERLVVGAAELHLKTTVFCFLSARDLAYKLHIDSFRNGVKRGPRRAPLGVYSAAGSATATSAVSSATTSSVSTAATSSVSAAATATSVSVTAASAPFTAAT